MEPQQSTAEEFLTDPQLCNKLGVDPRTSRQWRQDGAGPPYLRVGPRRILYRAADVDAWLASRTYRHRAEEVTTRKAA